MLIKKQQFFEKISHQSVLAHSDPLFQKKPSILVVFLGLSHYSPPPPPPPPHEIIAPHYGIITMFGGAIGYVTTKLGGL